MTPRPHGGSHVGAANTGFANASSDAPDRNTGGPSVRGRQQTLSSVDEHVGGVVTPNSPTFTGADHTDPKRGVGMVCRICPNRIGVGAGDAIHA